MLKVYVMMKTRAQYPSEASNNIVTVRRTTQASNNQSKLPARNVIKHQSVIKPNHYSATQFKNKPNSCLSCAFPQFS